MYRFKQKLILSADSQRERQEPFFIAWRDGKFQRKKKLRSLHADQKCRLGNDTLICPRQGPRLHWIHDVQLLRSFTCRTSFSRYKWSMPMLRHKILIIPRNLKKTDFILCLIPKLALLESLYVKSLT